MNWRKFLTGSLRAIQRSPRLAFNNMRPTDLPRAAGVYLITVKSKPYYIGRTKNLQQRICRDHLSNNLRSAALQKYLIDGKECRNKNKAKLFLKQFASVRWIKQEKMRIRGALEGYFTGVLFPKYGFSEER